MKKKDLKPGTRIIVSTPSDEWSQEEYVKYYHNKYDDTTYVGTILDKPATEGYVWVAWDEDDNHSEGEETEIGIDILTLESERSKIEDDFKLFAAQIKDKMKEAAKLVLEGNKLAKQAHASSLADLYDAVAPLVNAMDQSGWRSSSWGC